MNITGDVLEETKKIEDCSQDIIFSDPPYNLGSEWYMADNGKPECKKSSDFMGKWQGLTGPELEFMFQDFLRVLKHGGYCVFAGQMRQAMAFQYYAINAGFDMIEPIYSYSISNFPKALDVSKAMDRHFGVDREVIGKATHLHKGKTLNIEKGYNNHNMVSPDEVDLTAPASDLAKKYNGIKSSICPLKQTTEVWFIFRKPFKHKTVTRDIIAYEDGDETITPGGLNIDAGRVPLETDGENPKGSGNKTINGNSFVIRGEKECSNITPDAGRYPAQLFFDGAISYKREEIDLDNIDFLEFVDIDPDVIKYMTEEKALDYICAHLDKFDVTRLLDEQSGNLKSGGSDGKRKLKMNPNVYGVYNKTDYETKGGLEPNSGGCSRIGHNASFVLQELYQHIYYSKPSGFEREALSGYSNKNERFGAGNYSQSPTCFICNKTINGTNNHSECEENPDYKIIYIRKEENDTQKNNHPTLKSLKLLYNIVTLFNTVDIEKKKILIPFSGVRSEKIVWLAHGALEENITAIEGKSEYHKIGEAREKFWIENNFFFKDDKIMQEKIKKSIESDDKIKKTGQGDLF